MNPFAIIFFLVCAAYLLTLPRKWALVPLLAGCTYMTMGQGLELGPISLPVYRMLLLTGLFRVIIKRESIVGPLNIIDKMMIGWSIWVIFASFFHDSTRAGPIYASGIVFNLVLIYFLTRSWCRNLSELTEVIKVLAILLVPVAGEMICETVTGKNFFSVFGGVPENALIREGRIRAQGPFRHPILAGTIGATSIPLFIGILKNHRNRALIGILAGIVMVVTSSSSGPVMSLILGSFALMMWHLRHLTRMVQVSAIAIYFVLLLTMEKAPYYLIARIDISGGSTGWHRAHLIEQTFGHLNEWWLFGTDVTRHWMPNQGFAKDPLHTDITNYYIGFGVFGGLISMILIIGMLLVAFTWVGRIRTRLEALGSDQAFGVWCFGASLFAHTVTGISVAYFDQSMVYFWLTVAIISSLYTITISEKEIQIDQDFQTEVNFDEKLVVTEDNTNSEWRNRIRYQTPKRSLEDINLDLHCHMPLTRNRNDL